MIRPPAFVRVLPAALLGLAVGACAGPGAAGTPGQIGTPRPTPLPTPVALTALPADFPTTWLNEVDPALATLQPIEGGLLANRGGRLVADDGTVATYATTYIENRIPVAEITCGGRVYHDAYTAENPAATTVVQIPGWGEAVLNATQRVVVYRSSVNASSPALCDTEVGGTWELRITEGSQAATWSGAWHWDETGRLILA